MKTKKSKDVEVRVAQLQIASPGLMSPRERADVAKWLTQTAADLRAGGAGYTDGRFKAEFNYV